MWSRLVKNWRRSPDAFADGSLHVFKGKNLMAKAKTAKGTNVFVPVLSANSSNCSIKVDKHLDALLDGTRIEEPCEQMAVCEALCNIGLADHKTYVDDTSGSQEHHYTSTKSMRGLAKEWLYSTKHWGIPGD
jgi:hypothetical protein